MENLLPLIIQLVSGAAGGNVAGKVLKDASMGTLWNSVLGILGGGIGGQILGMMGVAVGSGGLDPTSIITSVLGGGVGGGVLLSIVSMIKKMSAGTGK